MSAPYCLDKGMLEASFGHFRECGRGREECQILWLSSWDAPEFLCKVVHPKHHPDRSGFVLEDRWLNDFWLELANANMGIRVQVHTHPQEAFHSPTDDQFPIIHKPGFLSLVIPNFGLGPIGFKDAYLTEIQRDGGWRKVPISSRLVLT
jgi:hypothetical protein